MEIDLIMKIGGSCLSNKALLSKAFQTRSSKDIEAALKINTENIDQIASEIGIIYQKKKKMIILTGVGSPGHFTVLKYGLHKGDDGSLEQHLGFVEAQIAVNRLRQLLLEAFWKNKLPVVQVYASSIYQSNDRRIIKGDTKNLQGYIDIGMVPVISGDIVPDVSMGLSVLSGDQILLDLAKQYHPKTVIFGSDVDGIFDTDPKIHPDAKLLTEISTREVDDLINKASGSDASGQMKGKLIEIKNLLNAGFQEIIVCNLTKKGILLPILLERKGTFTYIR